MTGSGGRASVVPNRHIIEEFIDVGVPHRTAYDQWTQYEEWSKIFKKESAERRDDGDGDEEDDGAEDRGGEDGGGEDRDEDDGGDGGGGDEVTVTAKIGPSRRQWQAEIVGQQPGRRIEWEAKGGVQAKGVTTFHRLDDRLTHVQVVIEYKPSGFLETVGNTLRFQRRRVRKDLKLFKNFVDLRGEATGEGPDEAHGPGLSGSLDEQLEQAQSSEDDKHDEQAESSEDDEQEEHGRPARRTARQS